MKKLFTILPVLFAVIHISIANAQNFVRVTRANQEQTINISTDQVLEIQLPRKAATGYIWFEATTSNGNAKQKTIVQMGDGDFITDNVSGKSLKGKIVGQSGTQVIRYVGASQGTTLLTLELKRPWVTNGEVMDSYTITVISAGKYTGTYSPPVETIRKYDKPLTSAGSKLPSSWDWRSQCTPIKDQNLCGDCWAYASVASLECNISIHDGITRDISEEFVTDCYTADSCTGCSGGDCPNQAWMASYIGANTAGGGAVYESEDSTKCNNTGITGTCESPYTPHESIDSYRDIGGEDTVTQQPSVDSIKFHIYYHGPVWIAVDAKNWNHYNGGIWVESIVGDLTHAVCLVGWKDTIVSDNSGGYWILRNSYSTSWGINGYMYISYGSDDVGADADYIVYKGGNNSAGLHKISAMLNNDIMIYPDPASDIITVENTAFTNGQSISIYNIEGQLLLQQPMQQAKTNIAVAAFSKGLYFLKVENENSFTLRKFIKE